MAGSAKSTFVLLVAVIGLVTAYFVWLAPEGTEKLPPLVSADSAGEPSGEQPPATKQPPDDPGEIRMPSLGGFAPSSSVKRSGFLSDAASETVLLPQKPDRMKPATAEINSAEAEDAREAWDTPLQNGHEMSNAIAVEDGGKDMEELDLEPPVTEGTGGEIGSSDPADTAPPPQETPRANVPASVETWIVKSGDTLYVIAEKWFGDPTKWELIRDANPGIDPDRLQVGQSLQLPAKSASLVRTSSAVRSGIYIVGSGDTLSSIARSQLGSANLWKLIYDANRDIIEGGPDDIQVGMKLRIPPKPKQE